jgi:hypothetical protein
MTGPFAGDPRSNRERILGGDLHIARGVLAGFLPHP